MADGSARLSFDVRHGGALHDAALDPSGRWIATGGGDGTLRIHDARKSGEETELACVPAHDGALWQLAWAPHASPLAGAVATCGADGRVKIWREVQGKWQQQRESAVVHQGGACTVAWAPPEYGAVLASGGVDGMLVIATQAKGGEWSEERFQAHAGGVTAVSWAPFLTSGVFIQPMRDVDRERRRLVSGGCDGQVLVWQHNHETGSWDAISSLKEHSRHGSVAVRDVAWAPNVGLPYDYIASCGDDRQAIVWRQEMPGFDWRFRNIPTGSATPCRVSWSLAGTLLAVSCDDNSVSLYKEAANADWVLASVID
eukprot:TRINITY_DN7340_c0_g1_i1.p2 TRINITY_DN7340_c0_g1~~TRINITY_DN7340_c0_g1_i1.p2  ORF type:complete len:313 (+),score=55.61 TRINITY_DN7340_c0_g1_i1:143-1081(+)